MNLNVLVHIHWQENLYHSDLYIRICNPNIRPLKQMQTFIVLILIIVTAWCTDFPNAIHAL